MEKCGFIVIPKGAIKDVVDNYHIYNTDWLLDNLDEEYERLKTLKKWKDKNKDRDFKKELEDIKAKIIEEFENEI